MTQPLKRRVGIIGGGQLGRMLAQAARAQGLSPILFEAAADAPAAEFCDEIFADAPAAFLARVEVVAFENEWVDTRAWGEASANLPTRFAPPLAVLERLRDKLSQKRLLEELEIPAPAYLALDSAAGIHGFLEKVWARFGERVVFKWARQGYDGHGVFLADFSQSGEEEAVEAFARKALDRGIPIYAEERVDFTRELAIVAARARSGEFAAYPLVVSEQRGGICYRVTGPATALGTDSATEARALETARRLAEAERLEGVFAIEFFEARDGRLLVNEIAPRVHNSGHFTQDACEVSQFSQHWRAILGESLGATKARAPFAMLNLLGPEGLPRARAAQVTGPAPPPAPLFLHWYGKRECRPRRKMGHVNALADSETELPRLIKELDRYRESWAEGLRSGADSPAGTDS